MQHTNRIAIKVLCEEHEDYKNNKENRWHYDIQYRLIVKALDEFKKLNKSDVIKSVCKHEWKETNSGYLSYCTKCNAEM